MKAPQNLPRAVGLAGPGKFLITTAIDYTNDVIHLGHAYQKILADALARYHRLKGDQVFFLTGTDEHGQNIEKAAAKNNQDPKTWCDEVAAEDQKQLESLDIRCDRFIRTTDADHEETALWFYKKVLENGDIYPGSYNGYYCESCEAYKTLSELVDGRCELHPSLEPKRIIEKNYFFRWSKYSDFLKDFLMKNPKFILPEARRREMLAFLERGLEDIPVTRQNINWGFKAPNDPKQTVYVWFDALINYYTAARPEGFWDKATTIIHVLGKDNTRWHTLLWPAMLKSAGLRLPDITLNHAFLTLEGKKISKTLGNIIRPTELTAKYGADAVRYYLLRYGPLFDDADISTKKLEEVYNTDLANNLGNLVSRVAKLCENAKLEFPQNKSVGFDRTVGSNLEGLRVDLALQGFFETKIKEANDLIDRERPWELQGIKLERTLNQLVQNLRAIAFNLGPFIPEASQKISKQFDGPNIKSMPPLFPRL